MRLAIHHAWLGVSGATNNVAMSRAGVQVEQGGALIQQGTLAISALNNATIGTLLYF